ncbi:Putative Amidohydrolase [Aspergillus calidoustus]|uniref:Putative Amidohydrolase n=1 Tax=Aspergillus calidoustus TaxID=454130 RepID=A0A0U5FVP3_ASPCI|nr:Putative Amidohydrolase [Aspergillus calidoustus]
MQEFNANLRNAIARGLTPGPRLFVATKVLASTGSFELRTENCAGGHCLPAGADAVDGVEQCRQAVRRRIAAGADIIKFFADYRRRIGLRPSSILIFQACCIRPRSLVPITWCSRKK